jgi:hypothetical protein
MTTLSSDFYQESYGNPLSEIKTRVRIARFSAMQKVNAELIILYWDLGKVIFEAQAKQGWGKRVVEHLEAALKEGSPATLGLSARSLWQLLNFYQTYRGDELLQQLVAEVGWGQERKKQKHRFSRPLCRRPVLAISPFPSGA